MRQFIFDHRPIFARQGSVVTDWRRRGQRRYGPYYRLTWREGRRQRSLYLGPSANLAEAVREVLREVQHKWHLRRTLRRLMARAKASLREHRRRSGPGLANYGMYWKGNELRGWANYRAGGWRGHFFEDLKAGRIIPHQAKKLSPSVRQLLFQPLTLVAAAIDAAKARLAQPACGPSLPPAATSPTVATAAFPADLRPNVGPACGRSFRSPTTRVRGRPGTFAPSGQRLGQGNGRWFDARGLTCRNRARWRLPIKSQCGCKRFLANGFRSRDGPSRRPGHKSGLDLL